MGYEIVRLVCPNMDMNCHCVDVSLEFHFSTSRYLMNIIVHIYWCSYAVVFFISMTYILMLLEYPNRHATKTRLRIRRLSLSNSYIFLLIYCSLQWPRNKFVVCIVYSN